MNKKIICAICQKEFSYTSGKFSNHLKEEHDIDRRQYIILTEYDNIIPKCQCGYCNEDATFLSRKNTFLKINSEHKNFNWIEQQYILKNGIPKCQTCGNNVKFHRGIPNRFCSRKCIPRTFGFVHTKGAGGWNQQKVKQTVKEKYGVENVFQIPEIIEKCLKTKESFTEDKKKEVKEKRAQTNLERLGEKYPARVESCKQKQKETLIKNYGVEHYSQTEKFRKESSKRMLENNPMKDEKIARKMAQTMCDRIENGQIEFYKIFKYKDIELRYQSGYEYDFLELCEIKNVLHKVKQAKTIRFEDNKCYYPDFLFNEKVIIEIKSTWVLNLQGGWPIIEKKKKAVEKAGFEFLLILDKKYDEFNELVSNLGE